MAFLGKEYVLDRSENFDGFLNSMGSEIMDQYKEKLLKMKPTVKLTLNGDEYTMVTNYGPGYVVEIKFKSGVTFDETVRNHQAKTTITVDGNTVSQTQNFSDKYTLTMKREFNGDEMVLTMTSNKWDGVCKQFFKAT